MYKCSLFCSLYKGGKFIKGYMENILEQYEFANTEFIFIDCNSPDNEKEHILPYTKKYQNIKYYHLDYDPGLYAAWNIAVKLCSAPIIGNWNVDDRKNKEGLSILLNQFDKDPNLDVVYGITYVSNIANEKYIDNSFIKIFACLPHSLSNLLKNNSPHCMPLWRKSLHDRYGYFDENYKTAADGDFWLRCTVGGSIIKMISHPVGLYYDNPNGRSTNPETLNEMLKEVSDMRNKYTMYLESI